MVSREEKRREVSKKEQGKKGREWDGEQNEQVMLINMISMNNIIFIYEN